MLQLTVMFILIRVILGSSFCLWLKNLYTMTVFFVIRKRGMRLAMPKDEDTLQSIV